MGATVVFTDLDGTLLDPVTYSWQEATPALDRLKADGIPLVFVTSKTRAETEILRRELGNQHPFIVENGGAAFIPDGYFPFEVPGATIRGAYRVLEWGTPYRDLVAALKAASARSGCPVRGFSDMTAPEVAEACGFPVEQAARANAREYDEPFLIPDERFAPPLLAAIEEQGLHWTRGGRFYHVRHNNDKGLAVTALCGLYQRDRGPIRSIGLGDGLNDADFLNVVDTPVLFGSRFLEELERLVPRGIMSRADGPAGWSETVLSLLNLRI